MQRDEIGVFGNRNRTVANGMRVFEWPETGAFRVRIKASAILPDGVDELPLRVMLGHDIVGIGASDLSPAREVGTLRVSNRVDEPKVYELTGRIENFSSKPEHRYRRGGKIDGRLVITPPHFTVTALNIYDDGTLNDRPDPLAMPRAVADWIEFEAPVYDIWPPEHHTKILFDSPLRASDRPAYVRAVLERFLERAFRRPVSEAEVLRYEEIHTIVSAQLGLSTLEASMREALAMALISPEFLYHAEGRGHPQHELACRLSYFLWGSMPDAELLELARRGALRDREVVAAQAQRLLLDPRAQDFVRDFTSGWLSLNKLRTVPINLERFPRFLYTIARGERRGEEERCAHFCAVRGAWLCCCLRCNTSATALESACQASGAARDQSAAADHAVFGSSDALADEPMTSSRAAMRGHTARRASTCDTLRRSASLNCQSFYGGIFDSWTFFLLFEKTFCLTFPSRILQYFLCQL